MCGTTYSINQSILFAKYDKTASIQQTVVAVQQGS